MSMDEVFEVLKAFESELSDFNDNLRQSFKVLNEHHEQVDPLWHDEMRKTYDLRWKNLEERMERYTTSRGQSYTEVLIQKLSAIRGYLYGS